MRFEIVSKNLTFEEGKVGEIQKIKSLLLQTQTLSPPYDVIRGEFYIEGEELEKYIADGLSYEEIAEIKLKDLLEIEFTPINAHTLKNIEKQSIGAISEVRNVIEDMDLIKAEIKNENKKLTEEMRIIKQITSKLYNASQDNLINLGLKPSEVSLLMEDKEVNK